jgi:hypothetical protein
MHVPQVVDGGGEREGLSQGQTPFYVIVQAESKTPVPTDLKRYCRRLRIVCVVRVHNNEIKRIDNNDNNNNKHAHAGTNDCFTYLRVLLVLQAPRHHSIKE